MFPTIFVMGTADLGRHTRRAAGILMMGVSGGAVFPPIQGAIGDAYSTRISFLVPMVGFIVVLAYAIFHWIKHGYKVRRVTPTVDIHAVATPEQRGATVIISQETIDTQRKLSRSSQPTNTLNHLPRSTPVSQAPETYTSENAEQPITTTEHL